METKLTLLAELWGKLHKELCIILSMADEMDDLVQGEERAEKSERNALKKQSLEIEQRLRDVMRALAQFQDEAKQV